MPESRTAAPGQVYQLKVTLCDARPPIWRRLLVPSDVTLGKLHRILQAAMGWTDSHLHRFDVKGISFGVPDPELEFESERKARLNAVAPSEDCGGVWGYEELLETLKDPNHPDHEEMKEWLGDEEFDPEAFDLDDINRELRKIR